MVINQYDGNKERHGMWETYFDNGKIDFRGQYMNGFRYGFWESFDRNGELIWSGSYVNSTRVGIWNICLMGGKLKRKEFYL